MTATAAIVKFGEDDPRMNVVIPPSERSGHNIKVDGRFYNAKTEQEAWLAVGRALAVAVRLREEREKRTADTEAVAKWLCKLPARSLTRRPNELLSGTTLQETERKWWLEAAGELLDLVKALG